MPVGWELPPSSSETSETGLRQEEAEVAALMQPLVLHPRNLRRSRLLQAQASTASRSRMETMPISWPSSTTGR